MAGAGRRAVRAHRLNLNSNPAPSDLFLRPSLHPAMPAHLPSFDPPTVPHDRSTTPPFHQPKCQTIPGHPPQPDERIAPADERPPGHDLIPPLERQPQVPPVRRIVD